MSLLLKIPFSASVIWAAHTTLTRPQSPPDERERVGPIGVEVDLLRIVLKTLCSAACFFEITVILAGAYYYPSTMPSQWATTIRLTPAIILAWMCAVCGALIRRRCYAVMGQMFTFELSIRKDHQLVTTGPYQVVRHPAYSAAALFLFGGLAYNTLPGAYFFTLLHDSDLPWLVRTISITIWVVWVSSTLVCVLLLCRRPGKEDSMLRKEFGSEWEDWKSRVPYKLIPGIY